MWNNFITVVPLLSSMSESGWNTGCACGLAAINICEAMVFYLECGAKYRLVYVSALSPRQLLTDLRPGKLLTCSQLFHNKMPSKRLLCIWAIDVSHQMTANCFCLAINLPSVFCTLIHCLLDCFNSIIFCTWREY